MPRKGKNMKKFASEFKTFITRGNVMDLAIGVIIGAAFQAIVNSFVNDLVMPFIGLATRGVNFSEQFVVLKLADGVAEGTTYPSLALAREAGATVFAYGSFITAVVNFLLMAFIIFIMVKIVNRISGLSKKEKAASAPAPAPAPTTKICPYCRSEIALEATRCPHCTSELGENK